MTLIALKKRVDDDLQNKIGITLIILGFVDLHNSLD